MLFGGTLPAARRREAPRSDLYAAIMVRALERVRPKMTVVAVIAGLIPILEYGAGSEVMQRLAVPIGGMVSSLE